MRKNAKKRVLAVGDAEHCAEVRALVDAGFAVEAVDSTDQAAEALASHKYARVLAAPADLAALGHSTGTTHLPDRNGYLCGELESLRESEEMYRSLTERSNDGTVVLQDRIIKLVNPRFLEMSGYPAETLLGTPFTDYLTQEEINHLLARYERRMAGEEIPSIYDMVMTRKDGSKIPLEISAAVVTFHGRPADLVLFRDLTERKRAEEALQRALEETRRESQRASALESIAEAGLSILRLPDLLNALVERIADALSVDACCVFVLDEEAGEFEAHAAYNVPGLVGCRVRANEGLLGEVAERRAPVYVGDAQSDPIAYDSCEVRTGARSILGVPLIARGKVVGVTRVQSLAARKFTDEEVRFMQAIADRVAMAIDNAKLYDELQRSYRNVEQVLEQEQHFSLLLQRALLPMDPSIGEGYDVAVRYVPAFAGREIGGDFYDVFVVGERRAGIVIGDVSGKGLEAAALAAATRSTIHAFIHENPRMGEALTRANSVLYTQQPTRDSFVTAFLTSLDLDSGEICYAGAGHPPAAILRVGGTVEFTELADLPLGVLGSYEYSCTRGSIGPGDKLVLYTDGISEARLGSDLFNLEGIEETLSGHCAWSVDQLADNLVDAATGWSEGKLRDDAAIVVVERKR